MKNLVNIFGPIVGTFFITDHKLGVSLSEISRIQAENKQQNDSFHSKVADATSGIFEKVILFVGSGSDGKSKSLMGIAITPEEIQKYSDVAQRNSLTAVLMHGVSLHKILEQKLKTMDLTPFVSKQMPTAPNEPEQAVAATFCDIESFMKLDNIDKMIEQMRPMVLAKFNTAFFVKAFELNARAAALGKLLSADNAFFRELVKPVPVGSEQTTAGGIIITERVMRYSVNQLEEFFLQRETLQEEYNSLQKELNGHLKRIRDAVRDFNIQQVSQYESAFADYQVEYEKYSLGKKAVMTTVSKLRNEAMQEIVLLRVRTA